MLDPNKIFVHYTQINHIAFYYRNNDDSAHSKAWFDPLLSQCSCFINQALF